MARVVGWKCLTRLYIFIFIFIIVQVVQRNKERIVVEFNEKKKCLNLF